MSDLNPYIETSESPIVFIGNDPVLFENLAICFKRDFPEYALVQADDPRAKKACLAACWYPDEKTLASLPNIQLLHSVGAGVEHIPLMWRQRLPTCRIVDNNHRQGIVEYVSWAVLHFFRDFNIILEQQRRSEWQRLPQRVASSIHIGVMGMGSLGEVVADHLVKQSFCVRGWSRTSKQISGIQNFYGVEQLDPFLTGLDFLICLLPLTELTRGILNSRTFGSLAPGAVVINVGRGAHIDLQDLRNAMECGQVGGAVLDVFDHEPLDAKHWLWRAKNIVVTPHMASAASLNSIAEQLVDNEQRLSCGRSLLNQIDPQQGY